MNYFYKSTLCFQQIFATIFDANFTKFRKLRQNGRAILSNWFNLYFAQKHFLLKIHIFPVILFTFHKTKFLSEILFQELYNFCLNSIHKSSKIIVNLRGDQS